MKMAILFQDYLLLGKLPAGYMGIIGSEEIRLPKQLSLVAKQEFNQARIKLIFVKYQVLFAVYQLSSGVHDKQSTC